MSASETVYKIVGREHWLRAEKAGTFEGASIDLSDGYIHFSTAGQVVETLQKHFAGQDDLLLIAVDARPLADLIRYEPARDGALFPHLYGPLNPADALWVKPVVRSADGGHVVPELE